MSTTQVLSVGFAILASTLVGVTGVRSVPLGGGATPPAVAVAVDADDLGGVVTSSKGPEAGVWVIATTGDLPTKFAKIVVTDDQGRYLIPDLPANATYTVWVRGYGLVDSDKVQAKPGKQLDLTAKIAPSPKEAAQYYPAGYWLSLIHVPPKSDFPGTGVGAGGNGIATNIKSQADWIRQVKSGGCTACHQLGTKHTRELSPGLGTFASSTEAWERRLQSGQAGLDMTGGIQRFGKDRALKMFNRKSVV